MAHQRDATTNKYHCPRCGRRFEESRALGVHLKFKHGIAGQSATAKAERRRREREERRAIVPGTHHDRITIPAIPAMSILPAPGALNYCPTCGHDIEAAKQHLHPQVRHLAFIRCPKCRCNLAVVSEALRPELQSLDPEHAMTLLEVARRVSMRE